MGQKSIVGTEVVQRKEAGKRSSMEVPRRGPASGAGWDPPGLFNKRRQVKHE